MKTGPLECRHLSDLSLSLDLWGQECGSMSGLGSWWIGIPTWRMLACVFVESWDAQSQRSWGVRHVCMCAVLGGSLFLFLVAREIPSACVCGCTCHTIAVLLSIQSERPRWRFPPSANKGPGHPACLSPPSFLSIPPRLTSPHCWPSWESLGLLPFFPLLVSLGTPPTPSFHGTVLSSLFEESFLFIYFFYVLMVCVFVWTKGWQHLSLKSS